MIDLTWLSSTLPVKFYSNSLPEDVAWGNILVHLEDYMWKLRKWERFAQYIIMDIHVHRFRQHGDYPLTALREYYTVIRKLADKFRDRIIFVLPDLPYDPDYFKGAQYSNNIRKTYLYHTMFLKYMSNIYKQYGSKMIIVVQHRQSLDTAKRSCVLVNDMLSHIQDEDAVYAIGVGSLCINRSPRQIACYLNLVGKFFPKLTIHGFGVRLDVLKFLEKDVLRRYSYDSTGWTRPVCNRVMQILGVSKRWSCKTQTERQIYFIAYLARLCEYLNLKNIADGYGLWHRDL